MRAGLLPLLHGPGDGPTTPNHMKLIALAGAAALALTTAAPAQAGTLLTATYAKTFCDLRAMGASKDDARKAAVDAAYISSDDWTWVTINGNRYQSDTVLAAKAVFELCPELAK